METAPKEPQSTNFSIEDFVNKPFRIYNDKVCIERLASNSLILSRLPQDHYLASVEVIDGQGIEWHAYLLEQRVTGFLSFERINQNLIK